MENDYKVIVTTSLPALEEQVIALMKEGWRTTGGLVVYNDLYTKYAQPMVKETAEPEAKVERETSRRTSTAGKSKAAAVKTE